MVNIEIDGKKIIADENKNILEIARENNINIPSLCYHSDIYPKETCRLCLVEIDGKDELLTACSTYPEEGMIIKTNSDEILRARKTNLKLIFAQHVEKCSQCIWNNKCKMLNYAREWRLCINEWEDRKKDYPKYNFGNAIEYDSSKCIDCSNCIEVCKNQGVGFLEIKKIGSFYEVIPSQEKNKDCVYCGQCIVHCPAGAFSSIDSSLKIEEEIKKGKYVIFQFDPLVGVSIGEEFNIECGSVVTEKMIAGIRKIGAKKVFDVSTITDLIKKKVENELIERIQKKEKLPMLSSSCPAWVKFIEFYNPKLVPNLSNVKSPQIILGGIIKTYFAKKEKLNPKDIVVVSVTTCTSEKYEASRSELKIDGLKCVDYVLTTHELARMFIKNNIDLKVIEGEEKDNLFKLVKGNIGSKNHEGVKKINIKIGEVEARVALVNGLANAKKILENHLNEFDYIEVMSCPDGCVGGGGQPVPTNKEIRKKRVESLQQIDFEIVDQNIYKEFLTDRKVMDKIVYTNFCKKQKGN